MIVIQSVYNLLINIIWSYIYNIYNIHEVAVVDSSHAKLCGESIDSVVDIGTAIFDDGIDGVFIESNDIFSCKIGCAYFDDFEGIIDVFGESDDC